MIINSIELNNFRIYNGRNVVDLTPEQGKNIIVITGQNGFGKTTFLMSLVWCLYGRQMEHVDEIYAKEIKDKKSYGNYISNSLNDSAKAKGESCFSVALTFSDFTDEEVSTLKTKEIKVERTYDVNTGRENLEIYFNGRTNRDWSLLNKEDALKEKEYFIRERLLALEVAKFFFFDAERIVAFANSSGNEQSTMLGNSYTQVLGIQRYADLRDQLERVKDEYRKSSVDAKESAEYNEIVIKLENVENELNVLRERKLELEHDKQQYKEDSEEIQVQIVREGDVISDEELQNLRKKENELQDKTAEIQEHLKDLYNIIPFGICGGLLADLVQQVEMEKEYKIQQFAAENVDERTNCLLNDLDERMREKNLRTDVTIRRFYEDEITALIRKYFSGNDKAEDFVDFVELHQLNDNQVKELYTLVAKTRDCRSAFLNLYNQYSSTQGDATLIRRKIAEAEQKGESELLQKLHVQKEALDARYDSAMQEIYDTEVDIKNKKEEKKNLQQRKENLAKKINVSKENEAYDKEIKRLIKILDSFIREFKKRRAYSLGTRISTKLSQFLHKKDLIGKVEVMIIGNDIEIKLSGPNANKIEQSSLSNGEKQMFSSAVLASLVDETGIKFPVFIDSPLQKFDTEHTKSILTKFYPRVSEQVVVFPLLHKELTEPEYELIKDRVAKAYVIQKRDEGSHFKRIDKETLFTYNRA